MKKKTIGIIVCMLLIITTASSVPGIELMEKTSMVTFHKGNTLYVGGNGTGNYSKIQNAIDNAIDGDTVFVLDDSSPYYENVVINKSINLFGENTYSTVIDGMHAAYVIEIETDDVYIRGFTIKNSTWGPVSDDAGIYAFFHEGFEGKYIRIEQNIITGNKFGIYLVRPDSCIISNNTITSNSAHGLQLLIGNNITIFGNEAIDNDANGINCIHIDNSTISYNIATGNGVGGGGGHGIVIQSQNFNTLMSNNVIKDNYNNMVAFHLMGGENCTVRDNIFDNGAMWECCMYETFNSSIYHNDIYGTGEDDEGDCMWDDGYPSGGNYWSVYNGVDNYHGPNQDIPGSDGIGDTPYYFDGNKDRYPLMEPWIENLAPIAKFTYLVDGNLVIFDASSSYDLDGTIVSYGWDFGDGTTGMGKIVSHGYNKSGTYDVTLTVTDNDGENDTTSWGVILFLIPGLSCDGSLSWTDVKPGDTVTGNFTVENIGVELLDWEIADEPSWGTWSFDPDGGDDLEPGAPVTVDVTVIAPDEKNEEFSGRIALENKENSGDICYIDVSLSTPKNKPFNFNFNLLGWLFERFPNAFPILRHLI